MTFCPPYQGDDRFAKTPEGLEGDRKVEMKGINGNL